MSNKTRLITLGVVVFIFVIGNIIAGYYKWGASPEKPDHKVLPTKSAEDIGDQKQQTDDPPKDSQASKVPAASKDKAIAGETNLDAAKADIQAQIASLKKENAALMSRQQKEEDLAAENLKLKEQLQAVLNANQMLEKEINELRSTEKKNREFAAGQSELQKQIATYEKEITGLRNELRDKQNVVNQNRQLAEKVQEYSSTSIKLEKRISELQDQMDQYQDLDTENQKLQAKLEAAYKEIETLRARLDEIRKMVVVEEKSDY